MIQSNYILYSFHPHPSEKEIIFKLFTFADTDVFFLACEIHLCQDRYCSMPTRSQVHRTIRSICGYIVQAVLINC